METELKNAISHLSVFFGTKVKKEDFCIVSALMVCSNIEKLNVQPWVKNKIKLINIFLAYDSVKIDSISSILAKADEWPKEVKEAFSKISEINVKNAEDAFNIIRTFALSEDEIKKDGSVFTQKWLSDKITHTAWQHWNQLHRTGRKVKSIADVSCGTGVFISSARRIFGEEVDLYATDINETSITLTHILNDLLKLKSHIKRADSMLEINENNDKVDILIGNPPYIRSQNIRSDYAKSLKDKYPEIISGNFDLSIIFIEHAIRTLTDGGIACYITTSKFMNSEYGKIICQKLANEVRVLNIIDFKDSQVFPDYTTYTSVITFAKLPPAKRFTVTHFPTGIEGVNDLNKSKTFSLNRTVLEKFPWNLSTDQTQEIIKKLNRPELPLIGHVFPNILQGLRTGQNNVYVVKNGTHKNLEPEFLRSFVGGEEIKKLSIISDKYKLIYPY
ncbi:MAG: N-6 DNA methylase, partial [Candidatus Roizmanbacteria bacterium]